MSVRLACVEGDGAGPEISRVVARMVLELVPGLEIEVVDPRKDLQDALSTIRSCGVALKGPLATRQDGSERSLNVLLRSELKIGTQTRWIRAGPLTGTSDCYIVRQTSEGLFAGVGFHPGTSEMQLIEQVTAGRVPSDAAVSLKYGTEAAAASTWETALDLALALGLGTVTVAHKAAAVPHVDGLFIAVGERAVASRRAGGHDVTVRRQAVDSLAADLVLGKRPAEVIVTTNLYGDILADVAGAAAGSIALVGGANIGADAALFEAAHGAVHRHADRDTANPLGLVLSAILLLQHLGLQDESVALRAAVDRTLEAGIGTADLRLRTVVGTTEFGDHVLQRLQ